MTTFAFSKSKPVRKATICLLSLFSAFTMSQADMTVDVGNFTEMRNAITAASSYADGVYTIRLTSNLRPEESENASQFFVALNSGANLIIDGQGHGIDMSRVGSTSVDDNDRAFYIAYGNVRFKDITLSNGHAMGGNAPEERGGGGGGMGAGGAIYVANGNALLGNGIATVVTVENTTFSNNRATGGAGGSNWIYGFPGGQEYNRGGGGGGGMGGAGGISYWSYGGMFENDYEGYGGGGGFGRDAAGAEGGKSFPGAQGEYLGQPGGGRGAGNLDGDTGSTAGGTNGGGGGSGDSRVYFGTPKGGGGGGGIGGTDATTTHGGQGGYGGGGGGGWEYGGDGGWGGGGGASVHYITDSNNWGGNGGFGGGGATGKNVGSGGFGGGNGYSFGSWLHGGGGMGAGGAIFTEKGVSLILSDSQFDGNSVVEGAGDPYTGEGTTSFGAAIGATLFLGSDVTLHVSSGNNASLNGLGGGGDTSNFRVNGRDTNGDAQGGIIKTGAGTLTLSGENAYNYAGATQVVEGRLVLNATAADAAFITTTSHYEIASGAELAIHGRNTPAEIRMQAGGKLSLSGTRIDLANTVFDQGSIDVQGQITSFRLAADNDIRLSANDASIDLINQRITFVNPKDVEIETFHWREGVKFEITLGESSLRIRHGSDFSLIGSDLIEINIQGVAGGVVAGSRVDVLSFASSTPFSLAAFELVTGFEGFRGELVSYIAFDNSTILAVEVHAIPEASTVHLLSGVFALGWLAYRGTRRRRRALGAE